MNYCAAIFDIIDSRLYSKRFYVQRVVKDSINYLNYLFRENIKKDVVFGAGDEFQGLFKDIATAFLYVRKLQMLIYPIKIRCGLGYGSIKYYQEEWSSTEIDGEAYYYAREGLETIPSKGRNVIFFNCGNKYDKYLNMYSLANTELKSRQSQMAKLIELLADIICPLSNRENYYREDLYFYEKLLKLKIDLIYENNYMTNSRKNYTDKIINFNADLLFKYKFDDYIINDSKLYIDYFWERGLSSLLAEAIGTSRQNIDQHIRLGKIKESRNMDGTILMMLGEKKW